MTLIERVQSIYRRVMHWWRPVSDSRSEAAPPPKRALSMKPQFDLNSGEFFFREAILDQLDYYFTCIRRLRRDPDAFALYSRMGALLVPRPLVDDGDEPFIDRTRVSPWFAQTLPDFGAVFYGDVALRREAEAKDEGVWPRFFYFRKYKAGRAPWKIEPVHDGAVYVVTNYFDKPGQAGWKGGPAEFAMVVGKDGSMRLLRTRTTESVAIHHRHGRLRGRSSVIERPVWVKGGEFAAEWASQHHMSPEMHSQFLFAHATTLFELANASMIRVSVNRDDLTAVFSVNIKRTPYFFKDRDLRVNENGNRKRIFHIVRPHVRASGKAVKLHFRGERAFEWNGYRVVITVPGKHHVDFTEMNCGLVDGREGERIGMEELGEVARKHIQHGANLREELLREDREKAA